MDVGKLIAEAEAELTKIERQLLAMRPLVERKKVLEGMLFHARKLASVDAPPAARKQRGKVKSAARPAVDRSPAARTHTVSPERGALWEGVKAVIAQAGYPMKAADVVEALTARGWKLSQHAREVVRGAINRRPDVFVHTPDGYFLVEVKTARNGGGEASP